MEVKISKCYFSYKSQHKSDRRVKLGESWDSRVVVQYIYGVPLGLYCSRSFWDHSAHLQLFSKIPLKKPLLLAIQYY